MGSGDTDVARMLATLVIERRPEPYTYVTGDARRWRGERRR